jgi:hypothetical protein
VKEFMVNHGYGVARVTDTAGIVARPRPALLLRAGLAMLLGVSLSLPTLSALACADENEPPPAASAPASAPVQGKQGPKVARQRETSVSQEPMRRGDRYGEVLVVRRKGLSAEAEVWGTQGISDCPAESWNALDAETIRSKTGARRVILNGPRIWLPNTTTGSRPSAKRATFGKLEMGLIATLDLERGQKATPYRERVVPRTTTFTFNRGEEIYELTSPKGAVYVMQSMSQIVDPDLTLDQLGTLGSRLALPRGWTYRARKLEVDLVLAIEGEAVVLQDDLKNTYLRR